MLMYLSTQTSNESDRIQLEKLSKVFQTIRIMIIKSCNIRHFNLAKTNFNYFIGSYSL